jgi:hypothetical protein
MIEKEINNNIEQQKILFSGTVAYVEVFYISNKIV